MPSKAKLIQEGLNVLEALAKDTGLLREALEAKTPPATTPRGGRLFPQAPMYTPDVPQVDLPRMKKVDVARAAGKKPAYTERMQSLLDSPTVRKKVDKLIEKGEELGMREWYGTEPLRQAAMEAGVSPEQYRSFMAQLASASQRNPVDQQNLMGSFLYHLQQSGQLPEESMLLTNKLRKQLRADPSLAEGKTLIELPSGYGSLAQSDIFERGRQIAGGDIEGALPPEAKLGTFYRNLLGNLRPVTVDVNAVRGPIIEQGDPRWLTSKLVEKDEEGNIKNVYFPRRMVEEGEMSVREAKQRPGFWEAAPSGSEYAGFEDLWQRAAKRHGVEPAEAQALGWYGSGDVTALKTKPELYIDNLERLIRRTAEIEGENPLQTMERILRGETFLKKKRGGSIDLESEFRDSGKLAAMDTGKVEMRKAPGAKKAEKILSGAAEFLPFVGAWKAAAEGDYPSAALQGALDVAGGPLLKGVGALGAKVLPAVIGATKESDVIKNLIREVRKQKGEYGARRVERAADEIPNLGRMYSPEALERAFTGDNAKALMTLDPKRFEKYAPPLRDRPEVTEKHIKYLSGVGPFDDVPFLMLNKEEYGLPLKPIVTGHEGRHRSRALSEMGAPKSLVVVQPSGELREPLPRREQQEYIDALREELGLTNNLVMPEFYQDLRYSIEHGGIQRPEVLLPDVYAKGGKVHMADGGSPKYSTSQAIKDIVGGSLSNLESMARGSVAGLVGAPGDINELIRDTLGINPFPELPAAPTSERILKAVPRITAPRKESEGMETLGAFVQPTDALVAAGRGVGMAAKAASPTAAKMAADFYEKAVESGMAVPAKLDVVKPKGGNWLVGGSQAPEGILKALVSAAAEDRPYMNFVQRQNESGDEFRNWLLQQLEQNPEYRSTPGIEAANQFLASRGEPLLQGDPVNSWLKAKLPKYIKNEMGTPEDPIRLQADAWAEEQSGLLAQKDAQIANAVQKMEKARQARGLTPEEMTRSQEQIRQLRLEREFIAEQRGIHYNPDYLGVNRYRAPDVRNQAGYPKEGMGTSEAGRAWEAASDVSINPQWPYIEQLPMSNVAAKAKAYGKTEQEMLNEGLNYIGGQFAVKNPEALAYSINTGTSPGLGFNHLSDELRNATNPESGLPKELLLSAKDLEKMSVPQAVRHVDKINAFRAVQKAEVNAAIAGNAATHTLKEYPEAGKRWVELKLPEVELPEGAKRVQSSATQGGIDVPGLGVITAKWNPETGLDWAQAESDAKKILGQKPLEDALKYEGEQLSHCVGGYCPDVIRGESRILSLRSDNGRPLATIELGEEQYPNKDLIGAIKKLGANYADVADEAMRRVGIDPANQKAATEEQREAFQKAFDDIYKELGGTKIIEIKQIKGRRNAPPKEHLNEVMDFLRDNPDAVFNEEGRRDLNGLGIIDLKEQAFGIPPGLPRFMTKEKFDRFQKTGKFEPDFKRGGIAKKKRYINVSLLEQEFRHKQKG